MYGLFKDIGKAFIVSGLLPTLVFAFANILVFVESDLRALPAALKDHPFELLLAGVVLLGALLLGLNTPIVKLYEGATRAQRVLLRYFVKRNQSEHEALYKNLTIYRAEYAKATDPARKRSIAHAIENEWRRILPRKEKRFIPADERRIMPTRLGNVFATIEEYPSVRYGMDGMVFWPRLVPMIPDQYAALIANEKINFDFLINLSLLSVVLTVETLIAVAFFGQDAVLALYGVGFALLSYALYRAATMNIIAMGELTKSAFDLFRYDLLKKMKLTVPATIEEERELWFRLSNYFASGESFYFPEREAETAKADEQQGRVATRAV